MAFGDPNSAPASSLSNFLLGEFDDEDPNRPKAHLFYVVFNRDLIVQPKLSGSIMVGSPDELKVLETVLAVPEDGYVFTFLTNYSLKKVFFDNLTIRHKQGVVRARYDYYPYGLMWGNPPLDSKYDETYAEGKWGQGEWGEEGIELYQYSLRFYNPVLGNFISPDPYEQFDSPYAANFNNPANFADPSGGVASYFFCVIGETLNFGNVSGAASSATAVFTATGIIMDINQSLASAGPELMQEYVNATGGPGGFVVQTTGENMGSYTWDPSATPDSPGFIPPGQWLWLSSGEHLYYTSQTDVHVEHRTLGEVEIVSTSIMSTEAKVMLALDILENFVPGLNLVIAAGKAAYYLSQGNIAEVGWAVAGVFGGDIIRAAYTVCKASIKAVKYSAKAVRAIAAPTKAVKKVDEVVAAVDEVAEVATKKADDVWYETSSGGMTCRQRNKPDGNKPYKVVSGADEVVEGGSEKKLYLYHYTSKEFAKSIELQGLNVGRDNFCYLTNVGNLSPFQAQIELALRANRPFPDSILQIDASGLNAALIRRVSGNLAGFGAGGGTEFLFDHHIPAELIKVIK